MCVCVCVCVCVNIYIYIYNCLVKNIAILILNTDLITHGENYLIYTLDLYHIREKKSWVRLKVTSVWLLGQMTQFRLEIKHRGRPPGT